MHFAMRSARDQQFARAQARSDADLLLVDLDEISFNLLPQDLINLLVLRSKGDFCISTNEENNVVISLIDLNRRPQHFELKRSDDGESFIYRGKEFDTIGEVLFDMKCEDGKPAFSGKVNLKRLISRRNFKHRLFVNMINIIGMRHSHFDGEMEYHTATLIADGTEIPVIMKTSQNPNFTEKLFDELRVALLVEKIPLPIRCPRGVLLVANGYLVYERSTGCPLPEYFQIHEGRFSLFGILKILFAMCVVLHKLQHANIFNMAPKASHFFIDQSKPNQVRVVANGAQHLLPVSCDKMNRAELAAKSIGKLAIMITEILGDYLYSEHLVGLRLLLANCQRTDLERRPPLVDVLQELQNSIQIITRD